MKLPILKIPKVNASKLGEIAFPNLIWRIPNNENKVYLTFDDGPIPEITEWVLEVLWAFNIKATFFCVGDNVKKYPHIYKRILDEGHSVGCHTHNHLNGWITTNETYVQNVRKAEEYITSNILRPPYGKIRLSAAKQLSVDYKVVMWDILSKDYDQNVTPQECLENVTENVSSGSIIVFHDSHKSFRNLKYALPRSIEFILNNGYSFDKIDFSKAFQKKEKHVIEKVA